MVFILLDLSVGTITFAKATAVNIGTSSVNYATLTKAVGTVNLGHAGAISGNVTITAPKALELTLVLNLFQVHLKLSKTGAAGTAFYAPRLTSSGSCNYYIFGGSFR